MREPSGGPETPTRPSRPAPLRAVPAPVASWWWRDAGGPAEREASSPARIDEVQVVVLGADLCALWVAHQLVELHPGGRVAVIAAGAGPGSEVGGTGCSTPLPDLLDGAGRDAAVLEAFARVADRAGQAIQRLTTIGEVGPVVDPGWRRGPSVSIAEDRAELARAGLTLRNARREGVPESRLAWLEPVPGVRRPALRGALGMLWSAEGAALHPGRLAVALRRHLVAAGAQLATVGAVHEVTGRRVRTDAGTVRADVVVCAGLGAVHALLAPAPAGLQLARWLHLVSEPIDELTWGRLGWPTRQLVTLHGEHGYIQAQHERSDRLVWSWWPSAGGRHRLLRRQDADRFGGLLRGLAGRLPDGVRAPVQSSWAQDVVVASAAGLGRQPAGGPWWLVAEHDDPLVAFDRAGQLVRRLVDEGALGG